MDKSEIKKYFDNLAPDWDRRISRNDERIKTILDNAGIGKGHSVLDVACGTGVLIPYYLEREAAHVTGIDISGEMIKAARGKFNCGNVEFIQADAEEFEPGRKYDRIMIYNAFPHFVNPRKLIGHLSLLLNEGGILTVAHGMGRETLNLHHKGSAETVSRPLMPATELAEIFSDYLKLTLCIDEENIYELCGRRL